MNRNGKALNASSEFLRGVSICGVRELQVVGLWIVLATCLSTPVNIFGQQFKAIGRVEYSFNNARVGRSNTVEMRFEVLRDGVRWKIRTFGCSACTNSVIAFYEAGFDGTNIFYLVQHDLFKLRSYVDTKTLSSDRFLTADGRVDRRSVPEVKMDLINFVWQAYASCQYYQSLQDGKAVSPFFVVDGVAAEINLPANVEQASNTNFAQSVFWLSGDNADSVQPGLSSRSVQAHFENVAWTNNGGLIVPKAFELSAFFPQPAGGKREGAVHELAFKVTGVLDSVAPLNGFDYLPTITSKTLIEDSRFSTNGSPIGYVTTSKWYVTSEQMRTYLLSLGSSNANLPATKVGNGRRAMIVALIVCLTLMPSLIWIRGKITSQI
jgi:hypothetical protein